MKSQKASSSLERQILMDHKGNTTAIVMAIFLVIPMLLAASSSSAAQTSPTISITVQDVTTGQQISNGETVAAGDQFQATVTTTNNIDCAGQFVVTAVGAPGAPPEVLVQIVPFIIGPASGGDSVTGGC